MTRIASNLIGVLLLASLGALPGGTLAAEVYFGTDAGRRAVDGRLDRSGRHDDRRDPRSRSHAAPFGALEFGTDRDDGLDRDRRFGDRGDRRRHSGVRRHHEPHHRVPATGQAADDHAPTTRGDFDRRRPRRDVEPPSGYGWGFGATREPGPPPGYGYGSGATRRR